MSENNTHNTPPIKKSKTKKFFAFIFRCLFYICIVLISAIGTGAGIGYYYQDEVKEYVIGELNKQLSTPVIVDGNNIELTIIKNFPLASIDFKNVSALDAIESTKKDTLFEASHISMQFSIIDIFKKNYTVKKIKIENTKLHIKIDKNGKSNYHFWKTLSDTSSTQFKFALEKIILKNISVLYENKRTKQSAEFQINESTISGNFSDKNYSMNIKSDFFIHKILANETSFLRKKNIKINSKLNVDNTTKSYKLENTQVYLESMQFDIFGYVIIANETPILTLGIKGKNIDIKSLLSLIPSKYKGKINDYESNGDFYFDATIKGEISEISTPEITAEFGIKNADIEEIKNNIVLKKVNLKGYYSNGNSKNEASQLSIRNFSANIKDGTINGNLNLTNLAKPFFEGNVNTNLPLEDLQSFLKIDTIETISGKLKIDLTFSGEMKNIEDKKYESITTSGNLNIIDGNFKLKNNILLFSHINADCNFNNNDIKLNQLYGSISESDFELNGYLKNVIGFLSKEKEDISIEATLKSNKINLNELIANKNSEKKSDYQLKLSEHIDANLKVNVDHIVFRKFEARNLKGTIHLNNKKMILDPIHLSTMGGKISTSGYIDGTDSSKILITCFSDVEKISINKMFESFENFGQTTITSKNIKGNATAKIQFASVLSTNLTMDLDKLFAGVDMIIENGELNNVESMKSLSKFIELSELENIKFSTLKTQIEIKNQTITIPKTEIKSNALNVYFSGTHKFNNDINYKIKLSLNELLSKKAKKAKKENDEFGEIADDGLGRTNIFLSMTGNLNNPTIKYDSKSAIQSVKQDLKIEKQSLKTILKEEFGMFKKDSTLKSKPKEDTKFTIKWEEADPKEEPKKELKKPKKPEDEDF